MSAVHVELLKAAKKLIASGYERSGTVCLLRYMSPTIGRAIAAEIRKTV